MDHLLFSTLA